MSSLPAHSPEKQGAWKSGHGPTGGPGKRDASQDIGSRQRCHCTHPRGIRQLTSCSSWLKIPKPSEMPPTAARSQQPAKHPQHCWRSKPFPKGQAESRLHFRWHLLITLSWAEEWDEKTWEGDKTKTRTPNLCPDWMEHREKSCNRSSLRCLIDKKYNHIWYLLGSGPGIVLNSLRVFSHAIPRHPTGKLRLREGKPPPQSLSYQAEEKGCQPDTGWPESQLPASLLAHSQKWIPERLSTGQPEEGKAGMQLPC